MNVRHMLRSVAMRIRPAGSIGVAGGDLLLCHDKVFYIRRDTSMCRLTDAMFHEIRAEYETRTQ